MEEAEIKTLRTYLSNLFNKFYVWKSLQNNSYNKVYNKDKYFWGIVLFSLQNDFLISLSRLFDESKKSDVFSIYYLLDFLSLKQRGKLLAKVLGLKKEIKNLIIWRNNILAHNNIYFTINSTEIFKKFPIKNNKIEEMIDLSAEILGFISSVVSKSGQIYSFKFIKEESEIDANNIIRMIELGYKTEKEKYDKIN